ARGTAHSGAWGDPGVKWGNRALFRLYSGMGVRDKWTKISRNSKVCDSLQVDQNVWRALPTIFFGRCASSLPTSMGEHGRTAPRTVAQAVGMPPLSSLGWG